MTQFNPDSSPLQPDPSGDSFGMLRPVGIDGEDLQLDGSSSSLSYAKIVAECILRMGGSSLQMLPLKTCEALERCGIIGDRKYEQNGFVRPTLSTLGNIIYSQLSSIYLTYFIIGTPRGSVI